MQGRDYRLPWKGFCRLTLHHAAASRGTPHKPVWMPDIPAQSSCLPRLPSITCFPPPLHNFILYGERGDQEQVKTGTGQAATHPLPHSAAVLMVAGWANSEPCASPPWPSGAPEPWELSDRRRSPPCVQICLASNAGVISPKTEIWLWFSYTPRRSGHYFDRLWRIKQGLEPSSKGS